MSKLNKIFLNFCSENQSELIVNEWDDFIKYTLKQCSNLKEFLEIYQELKETVNSEIEVPYLIKFFRNNSNKESIIADYELLTEDEGIVDVDWFKEALEENIELYQKKKEENKLNQAQYEMFKLLLDHLEKV